MESNQIIQEIINLQAVTADHQFTDQANRLKAHLVTSIAQFINIAELEVDKMLSDGKYDQLKKLVFYSVVSGLKPKRNKSTVIMKNNVINPVTLLIKYKNQNNKKSVIVIKLENNQTFKLNKKINLNFSYDSDLIFKHSQNGVLIMEKIESPDGYDSEFVDENFSVVVNEQNVLPNDCYKIENNKITVDRCDENELIVQINGSSRNLKASEIINIGEFQVNIEKSNKLWIIKEMNQSIHQYFPKNTFTYVPTKSKISWKKTILKILYD
jgi:hypothetical protein